MWDHTSVNTLVRRHSVSAERMRTRTEMFLRKSPRSGTPWFVRYVGEREVTFMCVYKTQSPVSSALRQTKMKSFVIAALVCACLFLLLAAGYPVSDGGSPRIVGQHHVYLRAHAGEKLFLRCDAFANDDMTLIYWLINGSFPEDAPSSDRIVESEETTSEEGAILHRSLMLKSIRADDFNSTFTCVVQNSAGMDQKHLTLI
ncbi:uncharacterized protein [Antennarius striatus]|uniref:uncharacterized protein isoform X1 n=1 Tax=Antennarius striatus TaxID=241820 RepID=UPI0035ADF77B